MNANPFYVITDDNPNETFGVRACSFAGQHKSPDCGGQWRTWHSVPIARPGAPRLTVCENHLRAAAADLYKTPKVTERKPKPAAKRRPEPVEELSL